MKSTYLIFILIGLSHLSYSQFNNLNPITIGAKEFNGKIKDVLIGKDGNFILSVLQKKPTRVAVNGVAVNGYYDNYALIKVDTAGNYLSGKILETKIEKLEFRVGNVLSFSGSFYSFGSTEKDGSNRIEIFAYKIDGDSFNYKGDPIKIGEIDGEIKKWGDINKTENLDASCFSVSISPNKNHLAIITLKKYEKNEAQKFQITVYDNNFNKTRDAEMELNYLNDNFRIDELFINDAGDVTVSGNRDAGKYDVEEPHLIIFPSNYSACWDFKCTMSNILISGTHIQLLESGNIFFSGFYNNMNDMNQKGLFVYELNTGTKKIVNEIYNSFDMDFQKTILTEKELAKGIGFKNYKVNQVLQRTDGKYYLVAEMKYDNQFYNTNTYWTRSNAGPNSSTSTMHTTSSSATTFTYRDNIIFSLDKNLKTEWNKVVVKKQSTAMPERGLFGAAAFVNDNKLVLLFNDNKLNEGAAVDELKTFSGVQSTGKIVVSTFNEDGSLNQSDIKLKYPSLLLTERITVLTPNKLSLSFLVDTPSINGTEIQAQNIIVK